MADDRRFSHPVPFGVVGLILLVTQGLAFLGRLALTRWGVAAPGWLAASIGAATAVLLIALLSRKLSETS
ncbi:MAG: hypothetical protein Q8L48_25085 [Archangium sp.]|nr:hypothetical protein [Archangium sp.]